ncbi:expressed unknown protein [Seminavis robusta]|uniref:Phospholipase A2 n=1 Tax=Seminavis robusta TaxID=568900 RepID=A0A9N8ERN6_9STRA|nr:expressed unknown protein [Seminavis robusta]|eukprot:Sro1689_g291330.1 n/a (198) ;mRNA; r:22379-22972
MKILSFLVLASSILGMAMSACSPNNNQCETNSGSCSTTVEVFLDSIHPNATVGDIQRAARANARLFRYGKYCGSTNYCPQNGASQNQPEPCNDIDAACQTHDDCLASEGTTPDGDEPVDFPDRCDCDIAFVQALIPHTPPFGSPNEDLCDAAFYDYQIPEAAIMAFPFCQGVALGCPPEKLVNIADYCMAIEEQFLP